MSGLLIYIGVGGDSFDDLPNWEVLDENQSRVALLMDNEFNDQMKKPELSGKNYRVIVENNATWSEILPFVCLRRDTLEVFGELEDNVKKMAIKRICLIAVPDGGIHRFGLFGNYC